ncbi:hypothetical protein [Curtobacterium oceanosedimentum]|uniref:hypothetical protein n=1 Tax=Curtobacterium oceanosedimentum TaxID=465820 RepID=UPI003395D0E2
MSPTPITRTEAGDIIRAGHRPGLVAVVINGIVTRLEPAEAADLGKRLIEEAGNAMNAERAVRRNA